MMLIALLLLQSAPELAAPVVPTPADYPPAAVMRVREGVVVLRLAINAAGTIGDCRIAISAGHPDLDAAACTMMRSRAHYRPARDAAGAAIAGEVEQRIKWIVPGMIGLPTTPAVREDMVDELLSPAAPAAADWEALNPDWAQPVTKGEGAPKG